MGDSLLVAVKRRAPRTRLADSRLPAGAISRGRAAILKLFANRQRYIGLDFQRDGNSAVSVMIPPSPALTGPKLRTATIREPTGIGRLVSIFASAMSTFLVQIADFNHSDPAAAGSEPSRKSGCSRKRAKRWPS